jgi:prolyl-tRNA synthetase
VAPFRVIICPIAWNRSERVRAAAEALYSGLKEAGIDTVLDDRDQRPGVMFADADLIGIPHRVVIGDRGLEKGQLEYKRRSSEAVEQLPNDLSAVLERIRA